MIEKMNNRITWSLIWLIATIPVIIISNLGVYYGDGNYWWSLLFSAGFLFYYWLGCVSYQRWRMAVNDSEIQKFNREVLRKNKIFTGKDSRNDRKRAI